MMAEAGAGADGGEAEAMQCSTGAALGPRPGASAAAGQPVHSRDNSAAAGRHCKSQEATGDEQEEEDNEEEEADAALAGAQAEAGAQPAVAVLSGLLPQVTELHGELLCTVLAATAAEAQQQQQQRHHHGQHQHSSKHQHQPQPLPPPHQQQHSTAGALPPLPARATASSPAVPAAGHASAGNSRMGAEGEGGDGGLGTHPGCQEQGRDSSGGGGQPAAWQGRRGAAAAEGRGSHLGGRGALHQLHASPPAGAQQHGGGTTVNGCSQFGWQQLGPDAAAGPTSQQQHAYPAACQGSAQAGYHSPQQAGSQQQHSAHNGRRMAPANGHAAASGYQHPGTSERPGPYLDGHQHPGANGSHHGAAAAAQLENLPPGQQLGGWLHQPDAYAVPQLTVMLSCAADQGAHSAGEAVGSRYRLGPQEQQEQQLAQQVQAASSHGAAGPAPDVVGLRVALLAEAQHQLGGSRLLPVDSGITSPSARGGGRSGGRRRDAKRKRSSCTGDSADGRGSLPSGQAG
jgi:hypothetical protein